MTFESLKIANGAIVGEGLDEKGEFDFENGLVDGQAVKFDKVYRGGQTLYFKGNINKDLDGI
jgi:hypothetical protein